MKHKKTIASIAFVLLSLGGVYAQEVVNSGGGEATGTGGEVSYSIGQITYSAQEGMGGSVAQGVQQPYEISVIIGLNDLYADLQLSVFPNPTASYLELNIDNNKVGSLSIELYNTQGKLMKSSVVTSSKTLIEVGELPVSMYILKVLHNQEIVKTFKIIKN